MHPKGDRPQNAGRDRRQYTRLGVDSAAAVFLLDVRSRIEGRILDLSLGGCCVRAKKRFPTGIYRRVEVEFTLEGMPFRLAGVVQSVHDRYTIGIRLLDLSDRKRAQLSMVIAELEEALRLRLEQEYLEQEAHGPIPAEEKTAAQDAADPASAG